MDDFTQGTVFQLAPDDYQSNDWYGVMLDGRIAYLPRNAAAPQSRGSRAAIAEPVEGATVTQAGTRTEPAMAAPTPVAMAERDPAPVASRHAPGEAVALRQPAPAPAAERVAEQRVAQMPAASPILPAAAPAPATEKRGAQPKFNAQRAGLDLTLGLLGSVTPIKSTSGLTPTAHVSGLSHVGVGYRAVGLYGAPEYGQGGGFRSTMLGGGVSLDLIDLHMLRITALGGYATYAETTMPTDSTVAPVTSKLQGPSVGGMVSIPFFGPLRLAYRGQYVVAEVAGVPARMTRHSVGLVF